MIESEKKLVAVGGSVGAVAVMNLFVITIILVLFGHEACVDFSGIDLEILGMFLQQVFLLAQNMGCFYLVLIYATSANKRQDPLVPFLIGSGYNILFCVSASVFMASESVTVGIYFVMLIITIVIDARAVFVMKEEGDIKNTG